MSAQQRRLITFGGPFPLDRQFRGQPIVEGDLIKDANREGMKSDVVATFHGKEGNGQEKFEVAQRRIATKCFGSHLDFRYHRDFKEALRQNRMEKFYALDAVREYSSYGWETHYFMHYYLSRFMDGETVAREMTKNGDSLAASGYYFLHVTPDQLMSQGYDEWKTSQDARDTLKRLDTMLQSVFFRKLVAVSERTKETCYDQQLKSWS